MVPHKFSTIIIVFLLFAFTTNGCKKKEVCEPQDFQTQSYICFKQADSSYIIQNQAELDNFLNETGSDIADCLPPPFNVDFNTQTILAYYTLNCGNTLELCLNDADEKLHYIIHDTNVECFAAVQSYNVITIAKVNTQSVVFVRN